MLPTNARSRPAGNGTASKLSGDSLSLAPHTDLAIRRHVEAILELLRPRCSRCGHPLFAVESIRLGMGRDCRKAVGL